MNPTAYRAILHRLGVEPEPPPSDEPAALTARPVSPVAETLPHKPEVAPAEAPATPVPDLIAAYRGTLGRLWALNNVRGADADAAEIRRLLDAQARQCDELGPVFAAAVSRQASRDWSAREKRCAFCGMENVYHDPESGEPVALEPRSDVEPAPPVPVDASGWPNALPGLGPRRPGPLTPCSACGAGTFASYGGTPLCRPCALRRGGRER